MNEILLKLQSMGISPAESKVYLTLMKLGNAKAGQIISLVELSSSNVHEALEKLSKKGLISFIIKNNIKEYTASDPKNLELLLQKERENLREKETTLKELLPQFKSIQRLPHPDQNAEIFIGFNGIKSAFRKLLDNSEDKEEYVFFYKYDIESIKKVHEFFSKMDIEDYYKKLETRAIFSSEYKKLFNKRKNKINARFTDQPIPSSINIFNNKVLIISWTEKPVGYLIESLEISEMFKEFFESIWKIAKR